MAITRKLREVRVAFDNTGAPTVLATSLVTDDSEGTEVTALKTYNAPRVMAAAVELRDSIVEKAADQGKPVTF